MCLSSPPPPTPGLVVLLLDSVRLLPVLASLYEYRKERTIRNHGGGGGGVQWMNFCFSAICLHVFYFDMGARIFFRQNFF